MGNHCSSNRRYHKKEVVQELWRERRAVPVLPFNPNLVPGRVLCRRSDGYYDVGSVHSLCKPGRDKEWLNDAIRPRRENKYLPPLKSIGQQTYVVEDDDGAFAKVLVGPVNAAVWFTKSESIEVHVPHCQVREFDINEWDEMLKHFDPDLRSPPLGPLRNGKLELFIVQKVLLVSEIKITASYRRDAGLEFRSSAVRFQNVNIDASFRTTGSSIIGDFTLSATEKNKKLPVAFSGFSYRYDKFGVREHLGKETRCQADGEVGESSGTSQADSDSDEDAPADDLDVGGLLEFNDGWFAEAKNNLEIFPPVEEEQEQEEEEQDEDEVVDQNAPGMEDID